MKKQTTGRKECSICGNSHYDAFAFKTGRVCEDCLKALKNIKPEKAPKSKSGK
ncbi:MAG: hypothetical protein Q4C80_03145 [Bacillota bacterium]|nr:hypothetical protein [Bacillota bacterium]